VVMLMCAILPHSARFARVGQSTIICRYFLRKYLEMLKTKGGFHIITR
jgi:hypothetical protein